MAGPRPIHSDGSKSTFTVEKATEERMAELAVKSWPTWSTAGSAKYKVGVKSPLKVYDSNELSYIIEGKMEIIPKETGEPVLIQAGDFVTFPEDFECYWYVIEEINKHWYLY
jgi:mannose-6-phosphate isomerase-like protein (cupin superfamily)